jgi:hypothetical protein
MDEPFTLTKTRIQSGIWEGLLSGPAGPAPELQVTHLETDLHGIELTETETPGQWALRIAIPPDLLADGVQTVTIRNVATGSRLDAFAIVTGEPLEDDIRAEVNLLRAELDMLKRAFRRHCVETL